MTIDDNLPTAKQTFPLTVTEEQLDVILKLIKNQMEIDKSNSLEHAIEVAKEYKELARRIYPKHAVEVYVDKDTRQININFKDCDSYWNHFNKAQIIIEYFKSKRVTENQTSERIYIN